MLQMYTAYDILGILVGIARLDTSTGDERRGVLRALRAIADVVGIAPVECPQLKALATPAKPDIV